MRTTTIGVRGVLAAKPVVLVPKPGLVLVTQLYRWPVHTKGLQWIQKTVMKNIAHKVHV